MKVNETLTTSSEVGIRAPLSLLSNANRYPDRHATVAGTWIEAVIMATRNLSDLVGSIDTERQHGNLSSAHTPLSRSQRDELL